MKNQLAEKHKEQEEQLKTKKELFSDYITKDFSLERIYFNCKYQITRTEFNFLNDIDKSSYIEAVLIDLPLTPFILTVDEDGGIEIIDGCQRIKSLISFLDNDFSLTGLKNLTTLNGLKFNDLPEKIKTLFETKNFRTVLLNKADDKTKKHIRRIKMR